MSAPLVRSEPPVLDGKYAIVRELGSGGTGTVYEAEQLGTGTRVAVKILHPGVAADPELRARFDAEARAATLIGHPNVVTVFDVGVTAEGTPYFVMELLRGESLAELVAARGALPVKQACELMLQVLAGIAAAHRRGIVHCDLKPANVMVTYPRPDRPLVKVFDFGVARKLGEVTSQDEPEVVVGTPMFMAPEQVCGQAIDERTDVYAASAILYVLVTGQNPFTGTTCREVMELVARGAWRPVLEANPSVPVALANIIERGMARKRRERIGSAEELAEQLGHFVDPAPPGPALPSRGPAREAALLRIAQQPSLRPSELPESARVRVAFAPPRVTDSLLLAPRLPKPPARPNLLVGRDFLPLPGDPAHAQLSAERSASTRVPGSPRGLGAAILAMLAGFGVGVAVAWAVGFI